MRVEEREVTVKKLVYIADDGREFELVDDCFDHEFNIVAKILENYCYDDKFNPAGVDACTFAHLPSRELIELFAKVCDSYGCVSDGVDKPGIYMYSDFSGGWVNLDDIYARFNAVLKKDGADNSNDFATKNDDFSKEGGQ